MSMSFLRARNRKALSLIELIVVVAIIAVLIALVIPAIEKIRSAARKANNQNNLRQIAIAWQSQMSAGGFNPPSFPGFTSGTCKVQDYKSTSNSTSGTQTWNNTGCNGTLESYKRVYVYSLPGYIKVSDTITQVESKKVARTDWVDGSFYFTLLPFLGHQLEWDSSYGPMIVGQKTRTYDNGISGCPCTKWEDYGGDTGSVCVETKPCRTAEWKHNDTTQTSDGTNMGYVAGKVPTKIPVYMGVGDPTILVPNLEAPLSYARIGYSYQYGNNSANPLETSNTSYTPFMTETYTACNMSGPTYNSWAASSYVDKDKDVIPYDRVTPSANLANGESDKYGYYWTGITGDGTPGSTKDMSYYSFQGYYGYYHSVFNDKRGAWINDNIVAKLPGAVSYKQEGYEGTNWNYAQPKEYDFWVAASPVDVPPPGTPANEAIWYKSVNYQSIQQVEPWYSNSWYQQYYGCNKTPKPDRPECHPAEWYYTFNFTAQGKKYFQDYPTPMTSSYSYDYTGTKEYCNGGPASLVKGSLNISFMDGSVRSISASTDPNTVKGILSGQAPTTTDW